VTFEARNSFVYRIADPESNWVSGAGSRKANMVSKREKILNFPAEKSSLKDRRLLLEFGVSSQRKI
jgi:hypothetical protein